MNVSIISGTFPDLRCGVGDYTYWLCSELKKSDIKLNVITSQSSEIRPAEGITVTALIKDWSFSDLPLLLNFFKKNINDIVHIQYPTQSYKNKAMINIFPIFFKMMLPKTFLIVTIHDIATAHVFNKLRAIPFLIFADKVVLTVKEEKDYLVKKLPFLRSKLEVIPIGSNIKLVKVSSEEREKIREELGVEADEILLSHFGYILPKKKLELLIYSLKLLRKEGQKVKLIFISDFCPQVNKYHRRLKNMVCEFNLEKLVIWTGYRTQEEVSKYLLASDISVQLYPDGVSYRRASFLVALNHGLPVVTTVNKRLPDGLKDHGNILAVPPRDTSKLVDAIKELIVSEELRMKLGAKAKDFSGSFSYENIANEHFMLYQNLLKGREQKGK
ncbi:MAG: glycosyltransferase [Candidatus Omnitrophota bacterium]|nr:glycosyltransferase [Candidatus Omnitrophota bacterium]